MLVSRTRNFIFIHVQKTGGSSIERALEGVASDMIRYFDDLPACRDPLKNRHLFAIDLKRYLGDEIWNSYYKFAFVRNPWSRLVSWYNMCIERPSTPFMWFVKNNTKNFDDFLSLTHGRGRKTIFNQVEYVTDEAGRILVDFVGRYETLAEDFSAICKQLDMDLRLPHINRGPVTDYRSWYSGTSRDLVAKRFRRDIEVFQYSFE
jgi:chondroitin 4-sulfotransferase 11